MLRIHFTRDDLARVRVVERPHPLWETVLSVHRLRDRWSPTALDTWRGAARRRLMADPVRGRDAFSLLGTLIPRRGNFPDFLTPTALMDSPGDDLGGGLDQILATPRTLLRRDIGMLPDPPRRLTALSDGDSDALRRLDCALRTYHAAAVAPHWTAVRAAVEADRARSGRDLLDGGTEGLLAGLRPVLRWEPPVLTADYPVAHDLHLGGRGLVLVPSYFCSRRPVTLIDPELPPVVVYPARTVTATRTLYEGRHALERLLGRTRSGVLAAIGAGCTTGELALRAGISPASASQHATILREAGLVTTVRAGPSVLHTVTGLGISLLRGA
ncbi:helix-turn-helix domain-containing protein [Streptomyces sp. SID4919]|uniref:ArsR/SmtB family transcription factor n=1 Tax=unclassified Streptomyces TaxID=2593676 RepID=UPI000823D605|nr:helix-turn-helix domain-containing protein [Streptomyces sp. AmelKG-E11A]MYY13582.1 helix-turn-helix domain-containing protein [Streptomyces sp. SID4919]SCK33234.1 Helix-turn-helix domain-containing protein [Streptomyces sp. AmelKG-E11A]